MVKKSVRATTKRLALSFLSFSFGDLLTLADGRDAAVTEVKVKQAAEDRLFTTYNFTVADHHTYFAGKLPVWVHNEGLSECDRIWKVFDYFLKKNPGDPFAAYFQSARRLPKLENAHGVSFLRGVIDEMRKVGGGKWLDYFEGPSKGHTLQKHVGKTDAELLARFAAEPNIAGSSTFLNQSEAEKWIEAVLVNNHAAIRKWMETTGPSAPPKPFTFAFGEPVGRGVLRVGSGNIANLFKVRVVLKRIGSDSWGILTSHPD